MSASGGPRKAILCSQVHRLSRQSSEVVIQLIALPVLSSLDVDDYGLYPGSDTLPGLHVTFQPGLTLILGANGLGKTTLITILYRMLTGPFDIPALAGGQRLGGARLDAVKLNSWDARLFAHRVTDAAEKATASICFDLGGAPFRLVRKLNTLEVVSLEVGGNAMRPTEEAYQKQICEYADLYTFGDWILALRHLTFYFEDRRALVWDPSAQRELLRLLFLSKAESEHWRTTSREILASDSGVRNLKYMVGREERAVAKAVKHGTRDEVRQELKLIAAQLELDEASADQLDGALAELDAARQTSRAMALMAEQTHEAALRAVEHQQLKSISAAFPSSSDTARYILGQILSDSECLACGSWVPGFADDLRKRIRDHDCVVCGQSIEDSTESRPVVRRLLTRAIAKLEAAEEHLKAAMSERAAREIEYDDHLRQITELNARISQRRARSSDLIRVLPPEEKALHQQQSDLSAMRSRLAVERAALTTLRSDFQVFVDSVNQQIAKKSEDIRLAFDGFANGFLLEDCNLVWQPSRERLGESGELMTFAAFVLNMSSAAFQSPVRRSGPQQVSESQREFIDLAFRMALMEVATSHGGTLIIDAPESSLDAVFVSRAATVLTRFADAMQQNRLVITSNLVAGDLIPQLMSKSHIRSNRSNRLVDLLVIAAPTAATRELRDEYLNVRKSLFARAKELADD
ncbi:MAG: hypothetical protein QOE23_2474 [Pseudonocardiales bacterium]|nr:hypothetical protein [Pseudonocardiales bacterium]